MTGKVVISRALPGRHCLLTVEQEFIAHSCRPGQFVHVVSQGEPRKRLPAASGEGPMALSGSLGGLRVLRRPLAIAGTQDGSIRLLVKVVGAGSAWLARRKPGQRIRMSGPLGNGFTMRDGLKAALLVGGGTGMASLTSLCQELRRRGIRTIAILGTRALAAFPLEFAASGHRRMVEDFQSMGAESTLVTEAEDGLLVTEEAARAMRDLPPGESEIFACGPWAMMAEMARISAGSFPCQVSLEQRMACGLGACRACVVKIREAEGWTYRTVCTDGPVFPADDVIWE